MTSFTTHEAVGLCKCILLAKQYHAKSSDNPKNAHSVQKYNTLFELAPSKQS